MMTYLGTGIFWTSLFVLMLMLFLSTLIGRLWSELFPYKLKATARFYLSPVFGITTLAVFACIVGRFFAIGNTAIVPIFVTALCSWALYRERNIYSAISHGLQISLFGVVCGSSVLSILYLYGGFNSHTDANVYLTHANWLQSHAFANTIPAEQVTPYDSAVACFQISGLRMGGSFLLALVQALLKIRWSYDVYPAVVSASLAACCFALGFPIARILRPMQRFFRYVLLVLPALSLGGLVLSATSGFMSQSIGLAAGGGLLFLVGPLLSWILQEDPMPKAIIKASTPAVLLLVGLIFIYPELATFLCLALGISSFILAVRFCAWKKLVIFNLVLFGSSFLIANVELLRALKALRFESNAVVGYGVEWSLFGYIGHMFGVHGGVWSDPYQWTMPTATSFSFYLGTSILVFLLCLLMARGRFVIREILRGSLLPAVVACLIFLISVLIYRYFVTSPFPTGKGQGWSQFKLTDWAHPFAMVFVIACIASLRRHASKLYDYGLLSLVILGLCNAIYMSQLRFLPISHMYPTITNIEQLYLDLRKTVLAQCPKNAPIYLNFPEGLNLKYRQMVTYYLYDREVASDWMDDGSIFPYLPLKTQVRDPLPGECVVELGNMNNLAKKSTEIGLFHIGNLSTKGYFQIKSVAEGYDRETDGENWWYWVRNTINLELKPLWFPRDELKTKISFAYATRGEQQLILHVLTQDNKTIDFIISNPASDKALASFEEVIDVPPASLRRVTIETNGKATRLSDTDPREAAWLLRNFMISAG